MDELQAEEDEPDEEDNGEAGPLAARPPVLREATFMVPMKDQPGLPVTADQLHQQIAIHLGYRFGGCHWFPMLGAERYEATDPVTGPMIQMESMVCFKVAIRAEDQDDFHSMALHAAHAFNQTAFYWTDFQGNAHVEPVQLGRLH